MSISTYFYKNKELYLKLSEIFDNVDSGVLVIDDESYNNYDKQDNENTLREFHNIFRTWKRDADGHDTYDIITSKEECFKWLEDNASFVSYKNNCWETSDVEAERKAVCFDKLNKFWKEYPGGCISFC